MRNLSAVLVVLICVTTSTLVRATGVPFDVLDIDGPDGEEAALESV